MRCPFTTVEMARFRQTGLLRPTCPCPDDPECDCSFADVFEQQDDDEWAE